MFWKEALQFGIVTGLIPKSAWVWRSIDLLVQWLIPTHVAHGSDTRTIMPNTQKLNALDGMS